MVVKRLCSVDGEGLMDIIRVLHWPGRGQGCWEGRLRTVVLGA